MSSRKPATPSGRSSTLFRVTRSEPGVLLPRLRASRCQARINVPRSHTTLNRSANRLSGSAALHRYSLRCMSRMNPVFTVSDKSPSPACKVYPLPAFAMWTAFPSSDYYAGSAPLRAIAGRFGHPPPQEAATRGVLKFRLSSSALGADFTPCGFRLRALQAFPAADLGFPGAPDARPSIACRRSTSLATASPTSASARSLITGLLPSVRFPSP